MAPMLSTRSPILLDLQAPIVHRLRSLTFLRRVMGPGVIGALAIVTLAGILNGTFAAPMKRMPAWQWENSWLVFAFSGLIIFPWIINFATVPNVAQVYSRASAPTLIKVIVFGLLWGL